MKKTKAIKKVLIILVIFALTTPLLLNIWDNSPFRSEASRMEQYLETKYAQSFSVNEARSISGGLGVASILEADAYLDSDTSVKFKISRSEGDNQSYTDSYLSAIWSKRARSEINNVIQRIGTIKDYQVTVKPSDKLYALINSDSPSFATVKNKHPGEFSISLIVTSAGHATGPEPSSVELSYAYELVDYIKNQNPGYGSLSYFYGSDNNREDGEESSVQYRIYIFGEDLNTITSAEQLGSYFKVIN